MFSSNSFNVCPHCGKANALSARYCSSCGKQLVVPEEVVVCPKCHKTNSPLASFCGACGAPLRSGAQTKICPKCHREVEINQNVCSCGYSFGAVSYAKPEESKPVSLPTAKTRSHKGGRVLAFVALIFLLVFAYIVAVPASVIRPQVITDIDKGIFAPMEQTPAMYGYDIVKTWAQLVVSIVNGEASSVSTVGEAITRDIGGFLVACFVVITLLSMAVHLIVCIVRIFSGKRSKRANGFYLTMAILSNLWVALFAICYYLIDASSSMGILVTVRNIFVPTLNTTGWVIYAIPVYFWFFFFYSVGAKAKTIQESVA